MMKKDKFGLVGNLTGSKIVEQKLKLDIVIVSGFICKFCFSENIKDRNGYKVCFDCGKSH